jgi:hypothetical protein
MRKLQSPRFPLELLRWKRCWQSDIEPRSGIFRPIPVGSLIEYITGVLVRSSTRYVLRDEHWKATDAFWARAQGVSDPASLLLLPCRSSTSKDQKLASYERVGEQQGRISTAAAGLMKTGACLNHVRRAPSVWRRACGSGWLLGWRYLASRWKLPRTRSDSSMRTSRFPLRWIFFVAVVCFLDTHKA